MISTEYRLDHVCIGLRLCGSSTLLGNLRQQGQRGQYEAFSPQRVMKGQTLPVGWLSFRASTSKGLQ